MYGPTSRQIAVRPENDSTLSEVSSVLPNKAELWSPLDSPGTTSKTRTQTQMPRAGTTTALVLWELPITKKTATASRVALKEVLEAVRIRKIKPTSAKTPNCLRRSFLIFASATAE